MLLQMAIFHYFLWLSNTHVYVCQYLGPFLKEIFLRKTVTYLGESFIVKWDKLLSLLFSSIQFSCSVVHDSL